MDRSFMAQPIAPDYGQPFLFPPALEDGVPADHPVRFLREFVEQLDLPARGFVMPSGAAGRPPYAPSLLLKLWLCGCFFRRRAPRRLEGGLRRSAPAAVAGRPARPRPRLALAFLAGQQKGSARRLQTVGPPGLAHRRRGPGAASPCRHENPGRRQHRRRLEPGAQGKTPRRPRRRPRPDRAASRRGKRGPGPARRAPARRAGPAPGAARAKPSGPGPTGGRRPVPPITPANPQRAG